MNSMNRRWFSNRILDKESSEKFQKKCDEEMKVYPPISEDSALGMLNNVISGRICNAYNLRGRNLNLDADKNSASIAFLIAKKDLEIKRGMYIIVSALEDIDLETGYIYRDGVTCTILASSDFAFEYDIPILGELDKIEYAEKDFGHAEF